MLTGLSEILSVLGLVGFSVVALWLLARPKARMVALMPAPQLLTMTAVATAMWCAALVQFGPGSSLTFVVQTLRIKEKLLAECNLHTIVRLPNGVFNPYTGIKTNLLFFTKGLPTKEVWFYEHPYPAGYKSYSKTKPMRVEEFAAEEAWWGCEAEGFAGRVESEVAWKVSVEELRARGFNLDCKNPHRAAVEVHDPLVLLQRFAGLQAEVAALRGELKGVLAGALRK